MADFGSFPTGVLNGLDQTQVKLVQTAGRIAAGGVPDVAGIDPAQLSFYDYLTALSAAYARGASAAQAQAAARAAAEGQTQSVTDAVQALSKLTAEASNDLLAPSDRRALQAQADATLQEIGRIEPGAPAMLGIAGLDLSTTSSAQSASAATAAALQTLTAAQAALGARQDALDAQAANGTTVAMQLEDLARDASGPNEAESIQQFKLESLQQSADLFALAKADGQLGITLGTLDATA